jgi:predicted enzyme related to lactoylglutathione lyase
MTIKARYVHTNIVANDWLKLAEFYEHVFGCKPVPPERNLSGKWLEDATGLPGAEIHGIHLKLPGFGEEGPTLEIFQYKNEEQRPSTAVNRPGLTHIAFAVDDVEEAQGSVLAAGGSALGKVVSLDIAGAGKVTIVYLTDPEGNIIELQRW